MHLPLSLWILLICFPNLQVKKHSKHCRTCNRCVEGFDHHCRVRSWVFSNVPTYIYILFLPFLTSKTPFFPFELFQWLNNCVGKKNYTTFILLMLFLLLMVSSFQEEVVFCSFLLVFVNLLTKIP